jgi:predicted Fe-S protein YdhL (DUF1289 family)
MALPKDELKPATAVISPCVRFCTFDPATDICVGCGRSLTEILNWRRYSDAERAAILEDLPRRVRDRRLVATGYVGTSPR